jgi:hypothetical protein
MVDLLIHKIEQGGQHVTPPMFTINKKFWRQVIPAILNQVNQAVEEVLDSVASPVLEPLPEPLAEFRLGWDANPSHLQITDRLLALGLLGLIPHVSLLKQGQAIR